MQYTNSIHNSLQLTPTLEANNQISYLDLLIIRKASQIEIDTYHKPTMTNTTIIYLSNHPTEHKLAAYKPYTERMLSLPLNNDRQDKEWRTVLHIARTNNFPAMPIHKLNTQQTQKTT